MKGFADPRGKLWLDVIRIVKLNVPKVFIFENVKGLVEPRNKKNLDFLISEFKAFNYDVFTKLLNSYDFGLPQNRDRIFIVGIKKDLTFDYNFSFPLPLNKRPKIYEFFDDIEKDKGLQKKKYDPKELFGDKIPHSRNRFQKKDELNDFFIFITLIFIFVISICR